MKLQKLIFCLCFIMSFESSADTAVIAVASNMSHAIQEIADTFKKEKRLQVKLSFSSSGNLSRQIIKGAPFELFLSANVDYVSRLVKQNKTLTSRKTYAIGQLCLFVPNQSSLSDTGNLDIIFRKLVFGHYNKLALANPELAPYGSASITTLRSAGMWAFDRNKLVLAENISQSTQFGLTASVDLAFIPYSHALLKKVSQKGQCYRIPEHMHQPIVQEMVLLKSAGETAKSFYDYMGSNTAQRILSEHGYVLPKHTVNYY